MSTWTRRDILKGLGFGAAAALLAPFHRSLAASNGGPKRFVIFVEGNGIEPHNFLPDKTRSEVEAAGGTSLDRRQLYRDYKHDAPVITPNAGLSTAKSLGALAGDGGNISLEQKAALVLGLSSNVTGGGHSTEAGALSSTRSPLGTPSGPTIDHVLSTLSGVRSGTPFPAVRLGVVGGSARVNYSTCAFGPRKPAGITCDPTSAFNSLFGSVAQGTGQRAFDERQDLLDHAATDVNRSLGNFSGNSVERQKLERYLESIENMVNRQQTIQQMSDELNSVKPTEPGDGTLYTSEAPLDRLQAQVDMATSAVLGGLTNVVVIALGTGISHFDMQYLSLRDMYPGGDLIGGHDLRHSAESGAQGHVDLLTKITEKNVAMMASMARRLESTPEASADGTMLDNTLMLYMSDNGEKHHSRANEWPMLMMGGQKLGFNTDGRSVVYPRQGHDNNRQVSNIFNSLGHAAGKDMNEFGQEGPARIEPGPLTELWS
jgi:hypothetical protein